MSTLTDNNNGSTFQGRQLIHDPEPLRLYDTIAPLGNAAGLNSRLITTRPTTAKAAAALRYSPSHRHVRMFGHLSQDFDILVPPYDNNYEARQLDYPMKTELETPLNASQAQASAHKATTMHDETRTKYDLYHLNAGTDTNDERGIGQGDGRGGSWRVAPRTSCHAIISTSNDNRNRA